MLGGVFMNAIWDAFLAFNQNALAYLAYTVSNNLWYLLIAAGAAVSIILYLREEIVTTVRDEQQAL